MKQSPLMALLVIVLTIVYLGVAAVAAGGIGVFLARPQFVAVSLITLALTVAALFTEGGVRTGAREARENRWVLVVFALIFPLITYLPPYTDRIGFWTIDGDAIRWVGVVLFAVGGVLRMWPVFVLGRRFSGLVAIQPGHTLATTGIYSVIRHPSYLGLLVNGLGWALTFRSGVGVLLMALILVALLGRIHSEEKLLASEFGAAYEQYRAHTWRLLPFVY